MNKRRLCVCAGILLAGLQLGQGWAQADEVSPAEEPQVEVTPQATSEGTSEFATDATESTEYSTAEAVTPAHPLNEQGYHTDLTEFHPEEEETSSWSNGSMFNNTWRPENVTFKDGIMTLTIDGDEEGNYYGGEWRTQKFNSYGTYTVSMKPFKNPGVVSSFFTYTGPSDNNPWDEIDIEFLGKDTTKVQFNYFTNGVGGHEYIHDLGFDASENFHEYAFKWEPEKITWYVDGQEVHTATENIPNTPGKIMTNAWNGIGVDEWLEPYDGVYPLYAQYDFIDYVPLGMETGQTPEISQVIHTDEPIRIDDLTDHETSPGVGERLETSTTQAAWVQRVAADDNVESSTTQSPVLPKTGSSQGVSFTLAGLITGFLVLLGVKRKSED